MADTATNPKSRKSRKSNKNTEENPVTDIDTTEAEATTEAAPEAAAPEEPKTPAEDILFDAITKFASDGDVASLQESYRGVHSSARGKAQGIAMKKAMTEGNVDMDVLGSVLDAFNNLPTATKTSRTKPAVDDDTANVIQLVGLMQAFESLRAEYGDDTFATATEWFDNGGASIPTEHADRVARVAENVNKASSKGIRGNGGGRTSYKESIADLVGRGDLTEGQVLKGANDVEATVQADGTLLTAGESFDNPSAAARAHRSKEDGSKTSTNGWDFWSTEDGTAIGTLRQG